MTSDTVLGLVLALLCAAWGVLAWNLYQLRGDVRAAQSSLTSIANAFAKWRERLTTELGAHGKKLAELEEQSPVELGARVVELTEAVERLRKTQQRFAGRFAQELADPRPDNAPPTIDRDELRRAHAKDIIPAGLKR